MQVRDSGRGYHEYILSLQIRAKESNLQMPLEFKLFNWPTWTALPLGFLSFLYHAHRISAYHRLHTLHSCIHAWGILAVLVQCFCCIKEGIKLLQDQTHPDWRKQLLKKFQLTNAVYCVFVCCYRSLSGYMVCGRLLRCWETAIWIQLFGNISIHTCLVIFSCCSFKILQFGKTAHEYFFFNWPKALFLLWNLVLIKT